MVDRGVTVKAVERCSVAFGSNRMPLVLGRDVLEDHVVEANFVGDAADDDQRLKVKQDSFLVPSKHVFLFR